MINSLGKAAPVKIILKAVMYAVLIIGAVIMVGPFLWTISTSLKGQGLAMKIPPEIIPKPVYWSNYAKVWNQVNFVQYTFNSAFITAFSVIGSILSCSFIGFGFARMNFKGKNILFFCALATLIMPYQILMMPTYWIWKQLGQIDTYLPLILPNWLGYAFGIFLMRQTFRALPSQLYEAATIDGCNPLRIYWQVYMPLAAASMAALGVFTFMGSWNDVLRPLIYLTTKSKYTLTLGLLFMRGEYIDNIELMMGGSVIMTIPVIIIFLSAQKYFIQGIATSGLKG